MDLTSVSSNSIVDISEENDNTLSQSAVPSSPSESFERSCDNPECSAPRLISLVPKPIASEFVTEPMVVQKPTLINGFTTVFQIDGVGTRMEDIINESTANNTVGGNQKPKTVFRVVPNTHAHIVNYVVVEAAAETMQKIKANDPETMCKLLISQRLSAEQMLKKLVGKALETTRVENTQNMAINTGSAPAEVRKPIPPCGNVSTSAEVSKLTSPGGNVKRLPVRDENKSTNLSKAGLNTSSNNSINHQIYKTTASNLSKTTKTTSSSGTLVFSKNRISVKPASQLKIASTSAPTKASLNTSSNKEVQKSVTPTIQKSNQTSSQPIAVTETSPRNITVTKPVVWQAVSKGNASQYLTSPVKTPPSKMSAGNSSKNIQTHYSSPNKTPNLNTLGPQQTSSNSEELLGIEKSISSTVVPVHRSPIDSNSIKQANSLKRKSDSATVVEAVKRLRPRSPTRVQNVPPLTVSVKHPATDTNKLPTLSKHQKLPVAPQKSQDGKFLLNQKPNIKQVEEKPVKELSQDTNVIESENSLEASATDSNTSVRRKSKPLMGPASKMKALKAMADAKSKVHQKETTSTCQTAINSESGQIKIGETIITRTGLIKSGVKDSPKPPATLTKPCSVAITDIVKSSAGTDSDSESLKSNKRSRQTTKSGSEKESSTTQNKKANDYEALVDRYRGKITIKSEDNQFSRKPYLRTTRSTASPKSTLTTTQKPDTTNSFPEDISDSTLLTTPSAPSRVLRVVLPSTKNGIVNNPTTAPHPNLKISSVISGGETTIAGSLKEVESETNPILFSDDSSGPGIEQLQKELADLRRTVARLTQGKKA